MGRGSLWAVDVAIGRRRGIPIHRVQRNGALAQKETLRGALVALLGLIVRLAVIHLASSALLQL